MPFKRMKLSERQTSVNGALGVGGAAWVRLTGTAMTSKVIKKTILRNIGYTPKLKNVGGFYHRMASGG